jgi:hypothetical protein
MLSTTQEQTRRLDAEVTNLFAVSIEQCIAIFLLNQQLLCLILVAVLTRSGVACKTLFLKMSIDGREVTFLKVLDDMWWLQLSYNDVYHHQ